MATSSSDPVDVLARTLWGEGRGEGIRGMEAIACVVLNRAAAPSWWGRDVISVCRSPWQFSAWNPDDVNRRKLLAVTTADAQFRQALDIARRAVAGQLPDRTQGADHYHHRAIRPRWADHRRIVARIGLHIFYRLVRTGPRR